MTPTEYTLSLLVFWTRAVDVEIVAVTGVFTSRTQPILSFIGVS